MEGIEVRGKRKDNGEWIYGYYLKYTDPDTHTVHHYIVKSPVVLSKSCKCVDSCGCPTDSVGYVYEVIPETVGRYLGFTDKNGKKTYEGDILTWQLNRMPREYLVIENIHTLFDERLKHLHKGIEWELPSIFEIAGNVHDDRELLEKIELS